ncbi:methionyl-tRNA formyltransferase [Clostridium beijerinckii]
MIKEYNVTAILTQPDKPKGRGKKMAYSAVKEEGLKHEIPIYQPIKLKDDRDLIEKLKELKPDFIIVVAFGQILTKEVLDIPKYGCINLHASLLPMYRGAAPLNWAIINGEKISGNTTMLMDVGLDTGDMILKDEVEIPNNMTTGELHDILMVRGADLLVKSIEGISKGDIVPEKQGNETFYAKMLDKNIANIDWNKSAEEIHNLVRGLNPWPIAYTDYKNERMKIYETEVLREKSNKEPGTIIDVSKNGVKVSCKEDVLLIKRVQFPNGKPLTIEQYINGHEIEENIILQ